MPANVTVISAATKRRSYARNYTYANMVTGMANLERGIATDQVVECFKDSAGVLHKNLRDASTTTLTPTDRIFFADSDGRAASSDNFRFSGSSIFLKNGSKELEIQFNSSGEVHFLVDTVDSGFIINEA